MDDSECMSGRAEHIRDGVNEEEVIRGTKPWWFLTKVIRKKGQSNVAMESASLTPAPSHATVDIRAAAAACRQATAASAVA